MFSLTLTYRFWKERLPIVLGGEFRGKTAVLIRTAVTSRCGGKTFFDAVKDSVQNIVANGGEDKDSVVLHIVR